MTTQSFVDGRPARRDPRRGPGPDRAYHSPSITTFADGGSGRDTPGPSRAPEPARPSTVQSPTDTIRGRRAGRDTPGPSRAPEPARPVTVHAYHEAHTGRRAGRIARGIQVAARDPAQPCPAHTQHPRDGGPARSAYGHDRPGHGTSQWHQHTHSGRPGTNRQRRGRT